MLYIFHWQDVGKAFPLLEALSNAFLGINLLISIYFTFVFWLKFKQSTVFKCINLLLFIFVMYGILSIATRDYVVCVDGSRIKSGTYLISFLRSFLPIYTFFVFTILGYITEKTIRLWSWVFFAQCIYIYFVSRSVYLGLNSSDFGELLTNNTAYLFVSAFPLIYFHKNRPVVQYILIALLLFFTITGLKRGAILIIVLATLYFFMHTLRKASVKIKVLSIVALLLIVFSGLNVVSDLYENSATFQHRIESTLAGNSSGRDKIAAHLLGIYSNSDIINLVFGFGADGTLKYGNYAHNDWIEILFDQGILGLTIFLSFWFIMYKYWRKQVKRNSDMAFFLGLWLICNFSRTTFSMWYSMANIMVTMPLGYYFATIYLQETHIKDSYDVPIDY